jgi:hypothetical protein
VTSSSDACLQCLVNSPIHLELDDSIRPWKVCYLGCCFPVRVYVYQLETQKCTGSHQLPVVQELSLKGAVAFSDPFLSLWRTRAVGTVPVSDAPRRWSDCTVPPSPSRRCQLLPTLTTTASLHLPAAGPVAAGTPSVRSTGKKLPNRKLQVLEISGSGCPPGPAAVGTPRKLKENSIAFQTEIRRARPSAICTRHFSDARSEVNLSISWTQMDVSVVLSVTPRA